MTNNTPKWEEINQEFYAEMRRNDLHDMDIAEWWNDKINDIILPQARAEMLERAIEQVKKVDLSEQCKKKG